MTGWQVLDEEPLLDRWPWVRVIRQRLRLEDGATVIDDWYQVDVAPFAVIFALQNAVPITVSFLFFEAQSTLALILLITLAIGIFLGASAMTYRIIKLRRRISASSGLATFPEPAMIGPQ